jgi:pimeloyl-ACP methyl ester carboxylesterase
MKIIGPLTDPTAHGGRPEDAFHMVAPSLPGHGFSDKPTATGWDVPRIANAWIVLMRRLGYIRWVAQGGDWCSLVSTAIGVMKPDDWPRSTTPCRWCFLSPTSSRTWIRC